MSPKLIDVLQFVLVLCWPLIAWGVLWLLGACRPRSAAQIREMMADKACVWSPGELGTMAYRLREAEARERKVGL